VILARTNKPATSPGPVSLSELGLFAVAGIWFELDDAAVLGDFGAAGTGERCWGVVSGLGAGGVFDLDDVIIEPLSTMTIAK